jgi:UDP-N-acetylglucosamine:LPS N-acetylglucosamine transferase
MVDVGAAVRLGDAELTGASLVSTIKGLDGDRLRAMARASASVGRRDAAQRVLRVLREVARPPGARKAH